MRGTVYDIGVNTDVGGGGFSGGSGIGSRIVIVCLMAVMVIFFLDDCLVAIGRIDGHKLGWTRGCFPLPEAIEFGSKV